MTHDSYQPPSSKEHVRALSKRWLQCTFIRQQYLGVRIPGRNHACGVLFWACARWQCNTHVSDRFSKHTLTKRSPGCRASARQHNTGQGVIVRRHRRPVAILRDWIVLVGVVRLDSRLHLICLCFCFWFVFLCLFGVLVLFLPVFSPCAATDHFAWGSTTKTQTVRQNVCRSEVYPAALRAPGRADESRSTLVLPLKSVVCFLFFFPFFIPFFSFFLPHHIRNTTTVA